MILEVLLDFYVLLIMFIMLLIFKVHYFTFESRHQIKDRQENILNSHV